MSKLFEDIMEIITDKIPHLRGQRTSETAIKIVEKLSELRPMKDCIKFSRKEAFHGTVRKYARDRNIKVTMNHGNGFYYIWRIE